MSWNANTKKNEGKREKLTSEVVKKGSQNEFVVDVICKINWKKN